MLAKKRLNAGPMKMPNRREEAVLNFGGQQVVSVVYDFASDGGAIGTISFGRLLPADCIVTRVFSDEITNLTGATATLTLKAGSTALTGAITATAAAGVEAPALAGSVAGIKLAAISELNMAIATAAITAGKIRFFVEYMIPNN